MPENIKKPLHKTVNIRSGERSTDIPRRVCIDQMHPLEKEFYDLRQKIEAMPADPLLTQCSDLLADAADKLSDYLESE